MNPQILYKGLKIPGGHKYPVYGVTPSQIALRTHYERYNAGNPASLKISCICQTPFPMQKG